ncbi:MAG: hypothetical protein WCY15_10015 [Phenylobacterium sp.]|jgi:hypothetical protein|uniref:hypothetical protein n=1 Tax=Phenylobacterium sp. TaxID=1871053 RepID=UPI002A364817|nr:hypothetical protein [Phenylobacterium sp.]MDX9999561.1 hypothetical protein [Phenylobacterium sp.]
MTLRDNPNARSELERRVRAGRLRWSGPAVLLFARSGFAVAAHALVAAGVALRRRRLRRLLWPLLRQG